MWFKRIWPEIRMKKNEDSDDQEGSRRRSSAGSGDVEQYPSILLLSDQIQTASKIWTNFCAWLRNLREHNQKKFCSVMAGILFPLFIVGRIMSGMLLMYLIVMSVMIVPGIWIHVLSKETKHWINNHIESLRSVWNPQGDATNTEEEDEYMLEESGENLAVLSQIVDPEDSNDSFYSKGSATSIPFMTGVATMPSHDDISLDSLASYSELDLALENSSPKTVILKDIEDYSDDSSSNDPAIMDFQSGHFNGNESSGDEEENLLAKDLTFTETDCAHVSSEPAGISFGSVLTATTSNLGSVGQTLLTNVMHRAMGYVDPSKSGPEDQKSSKMAKNDSSNSLSSNDDFELISHDEVS
ncbi:hypothetical protein LSTR_LSTR011105 [Laodelphax striatellus]|uniref:RETREG1-3/ARL6IP-like N-terminal reticulon-homology domain-containing protein n=1 Tax=Laodelphax striatellus TaxID=195883 RepID=A0A482XIQ0_LAOST|nr:hypothetical protein LSTR_LSTR011105 [Laodelphax striatellus]